MENKEINSYTIDEFKDKLIRFFFSSFCYGPSGSIELLNNGINIKYRYNDRYYEDEEDSNYIEYPFSMDNWKKFVEKTVNLNIHKWKKRYDNKIFSTDCEEWKVELEFKNNKKIIRSGYDEYPDNWEKFQNIIKEYFPQMEY